MVKREIIKKIKQFRNAIEEDGIRVAKMILYGSYAAGKPHKYSDIDIAVVSKDFGKDRVREGMKLFEIASEVDPRIESVPVSLKSYQVDTWIPLIYEIRKNGLEVSLN